MKVNKLSYVIGLIFGGMTATAFAVEPEMKAEQLALPTPTEQHQISTKRVTARLTQSHYHKFRLDEIGRAHV